MLAGSNGTHIIELCYIQTAVLEAVGRSRHRRRLPRATSSLQGLSAVTERQCKPDAGAGLQPHTEPPIAPQRSRLPVALHRLHVAVCDMAAVPVLVAVPRSPPPGSVTVWEHVADESAFRWVPVFGGGGGKGAHDQAHISQSLCVDVSPLIFLSEQCGNGSSNHPICGCTPFESLRCLYQPFFVGLCQRYSNRPMARSACCCPALGARQRPDRCRCCCPPVQRFLDTPCSLLLPLICDGRPLPPKDSSPPAVQGTITWSKDHKKSQALQKPRASPSSYPLILALEKQAFCTISVCFCCLHSDLKVASQEAPLTALDMNRPPPPLKMAKMITRCRPHSVPICRRSRRKNFSSRWWGDESPQGEVVRSSAGADAPFRGVICVVYFNGQ